MNNIKQLTFQELVNVKEGVRSVRDERFIVDRFLCSFADETNEEYRIAFESKEEPFVPKQGTISYLREIQYQYNF